MRYQRKVFVKLNGTDVKEFDAASDDEAWTIAMQGWNPGVRVQLLSKRASGSFQLVAERKVPGALKKPAKKIVAKRLSAKKLPAKKMAAKKPRANKSAAKKSKAKKRR